ncbi:MAG: hypothetical protein GY749_06600 [Desulfobacteraceae bacterium]|nr:hypothetical protein [Desulfobacteraceae bacterium]
MMIQIQFFIGIHGWGNSKILIRVDLTTLKRPFLGQLCEPEFPDCSYGYRPGRSTKDAVSDLTFQLRYGVFGYIVEADIKGFFDNTDHDKLSERMAERINDRGYVSKNGKNLF